METVRLLNRKSLVGAVAGLSVAVAMGANKGKTSIEANKPPKVHCAAIPGSKWQSLRSNPNNAFLAGLIGVSPERMEEGGLGPAACKESISKADLMQKHGLVTPIVDISLNCVVVGLYTDKGQQKGHEVLAACAGTIPSQANFVA